MKIRFTYIVVALFLVVIIMFSTSCSSNFIPFSNDKMGFPYDLHVKLILKKLKDSKVYFRLLMQILH